MPHMGQAIAIIVHLWSKTQVMLGRERRFLLRRTQVLPTCRRPLLLARSALLLLDGDYRE